MREVAFAPARPARLPIGRHRSVQAHAYTQYDVATEFTVFQPPVVSLAGVLEGQPPEAHVVQQVKHACEHTGFFAITGHDCPATALTATFDAARPLFDLPKLEKQRLVVRGMRAGRGYEVSPEHREYEDHVRELRSGDPSVDAALQNHPEASVREGLMSERFMCGPPQAAEQNGSGAHAMQPDEQELLEVFFAENVWPGEDAPALQPCMEGMYARCTRAADAILRVFAVALGAPEDYFADKTDAHHSNMQVANYSSLVVWPEGRDACMRKKAHVDSGTLTILASDDWLGGTWQPGDGGLQLLSRGGSWQEVVVPRGALLVNIGTLMTRWTAGQWPSTLHRVTNPRRDRAADSRRFSLAYFHKVNADAVIEAFPSCVRPGAAVPRPLRAMDLTRQGILHRFRHLPPEEASARYHAELAALRAEL
eukprot:jgi/Ulvmu1/5817/UM025_0074.1